MYCFVSSTTSVKSIQEYIPVGCIPCALVAAVLLVGGVQDVCVQSEV